MQDSAISVEDFRQRARAWLEANLEKRPPEQGALAPVRRSRTAEAMAVERAIQRKTVRGWLCRHHLAQGVRRPGPDPRP